MGLFVCLILPVLLIFFVLWLCKKYNFSIFPKGMKLPPPEKFKMPKIRRREYTWEEDTSSDSESESDSDIDINEELTRSPYGLYHPEKIKGDFFGPPHTSLRNKSRHFRSLKKNDKISFPKRNKNYMKESDYNDIIDGGLYE